MATAQPRGGRPQAGPYTGRPLRWPQLGEPQAASAVLSSRRPAAPTRAAAACAAQAGTLKDPGAQLGEQRERDDAQVEELLE